MTELNEQTLTKSSRKRRLAAFFIDYCVMIFLMVAAVFIALGPDFIDKNNSNILMIILSVMIPGFFLYFAKDSVKGISVGRWIMGIMIRNDVDFNSIPSFGKLLIRNLFIIIWPVEFIVLGSSEEKKRLGDKITKTIVLKNPNKPKKLPRILSLVGLGIVFFVFVFLFVGTAMKNSDAYKVAIQNIEMNKEIINETGGITGYGMMPNGSVSVTNGKGQAKLQIKVLGKTKDMNVRVYLEKEPDGQWKQIEMNK